MFSLLCVCVCMYCSSYTYCKWFEKGKIPLSNPGTFSDKSFFLSRTHKINAEKKRENCVSRCSSPDTYAFFFSLSWKKKQFIFSVTFCGSHFFYFLTITIGVFLHAKSLHVRHFCFRPIFLFYFLEPSQTSSNSFYNTKLNLFPD